MSETTTSPSMFSQSSKNGRDRKAVQHGYRESSNILDLFERLTDVLTRRRGFAFKLQYMRRNSISNSVDSFEWGETLLYNNVEWQSHSVPPLEVFLNNEDVYRVAFVQRVRIYGGDSWYYSWIFINCSSNHELQDHTEYVSAINRIHHSNVRCMPIYDHVQNAWATQADLSAVNPNCHYNELFKRHEPVCALTIVCRHLGLSIDSCLSVSDSDMPDCLKTDDGIESICAKHSFDVDEMCAMVNCVKELTNISSIYTTLLGLNNRFSVTLPYKISCPMSLRLVLCMCVHVCLRPEMYKLTNWQRSDIALNNMIGDLRKLLQHSTTNYCSIPEENNSIERFLQGLVNDVTMQKMLKVRQKQHLKRITMTLNKMANIGEQLVMMCFRLHQRTFDATEQSKRCKALMKHGTQYVDNGVPCDMLDSYTCNVVRRLQRTGFAPNNVPAYTMWPINTLIDKDQMHRLFSNNIMGITNVYFTTKVYDDNRAYKRIIEDTKSTMENMLQDDFSAIQDIGKYEQVHLVILNPKHTLFCLECSKSITFAEMTLPPMNQQCINCQGLCCLSCVSKICDWNSYYICRACEHGNDPACTI